jgi:lipoprotein-anchoring transpeptidase ErfK/SrfK
VTPVTSMFAVTSRFMRVKVGILAAGLVASVLSFGAAANADETSTSTTDETTTSVEDTTTTTDETTTTTIVCAPPTTDSSPTTSDSTTTTVADCVTPTTIDDPTTTADTAATTSSTTEPGGIGIDPASPGAGPPIRGTQVQTRPIPPPPTTTTTTTTTTLPTFGLPSNSGSGRRVVYSKSRQRLWVVDSSGRVIKTHLVSGRQTPRDPSPGSYKVWSRSRYTFSINNPSITWGYMVRFAWGARGGNIGFHEIPNQYGRPVQSVWQLGTPLSGGCVRQSVPDAIWMWNWAQLGTRVVVLG